MANYKETTTSGTSYTRSNTVILTNEPEFKHIEFQEERIITLADGEMIRQRGGAVDAEFTADNVSTTFALVNPFTLEATGATAAYADVYGLVTSLYLHLAQERDAYVAPEATAPVDVDPVQQAQDELDALTVRQAELESFLADTQGN